MKHLWKGLTLSWDLILSPPCLSWNLALLFHSRQIQKAPDPSQLPLLLEQAVECYTVFTVSVSSGHCGAKATGYFSAVT